MGEIKWAKIQSIEKSGVHRKMGIAFLMMSLVPIMVMLYLVQYPLQEMLTPSWISYIHWLIFLMICASLTGYWLNRRIASAVSSMAKDAKEIVQGGDLRRTLTARDEAQEIGELVRAFNRITKDLEHKITALEQSKRLIQDLFQKVGTAITSAEKIDNLLTLAIEAMVNALEAESGLLMLQEEEGSQVKTKLACGLHREALLGLVIKKGEGALGWVVAKGKTLTVTSSAPDFRFDPAEIGAPYRSLMAVPLRYQGRILGLIGVINKKHRHGFGKDDELLLENVADQVAVAVENSRLNASAEKTYFETISALAIAVEAKDAYTRGHLKRVSDYVERLAREMGFDPKVIQMMKDGAFLHDLGKIAIPDSILLKPGKLTPEEMEIMKDHTVIGENIIAPLSSFKELRVMVRHHQEWFNGTGYPDHLKGDAISISARILAVADVYDALTTDRPYRKALSHETAAKMMQDEAGTHFDPKVVDLFFKVIHSVGEARRFAA